MKNYHIKTHSILKKITIPMLLVLFLQIIIFWGTMMGNNIFNKLIRNEFDILNERVINRKNYLENEMVQHWSNFYDTSQLINGKIALSLAHNKMTTMDLTIDSPFTAQITQEISNDLIYILRKNGVSGAFIIFNGKDDPYQTEDVSKSGMYIRDLDPLSNLDNNSDLLFERGFSSVTKALAIPTDTNWVPQFRFSEGRTPGSYDYFFKPFQAALEYPEINGWNLGYWSKPFRLSKEDIEIITYSIPLIDNHGSPYGVLGVEISTDYIKKLMPNIELSKSHSGSYLLAVAGEAMMSFENLLANGPIFNQKYGDTATIQFSTKEYGSNSYMVETESQTDTHMFGCIQYFNLYNSNTPFVSEHWALIGLLDKNDLYGFSNSVGIQTLLSTIISLLIGLVVVLVVSKFVTKPISDLANKVKNSNPNLPVKFDKLRILEIDELSSSIEQLNINVRESASKLSKILEMASFSIAAFEYTKETSSVFYTRNYFDILGIKDNYDKNGYLDAISFKEKMSLLSPYFDYEYSKSNTFTYKIRRNAEVTWVCLKIVEDEKYVFGVIEDITSGILEKKKIEHDRDYDLLTNLLNRRAFYSLLQDLFSNPQQLNIAVMIMLDLDNLKYINDTYGHDYGDKYIYGTAHKLESCAPPNSIISRMSGDEFYLFLYGYNNREHAQEDINKIWSGIKTALFPLPDNPDFHIRASMGYSWYPEDATTYEQLIHFADFAMYTVKHNTKGEMCQFDQTEYEQKSYLLHNREDFNNLIENKMVDYHFQPIINARTGEVFAYEALMRSKIPTLKSPFEILNLARAQSKLYQIEHLTWYHALETFVNKTTIQDNCHIFINSIGSQALSQSNIVELEQLYAPYLHRIVIEITEDEQPNASYMHLKKYYSKTWNGAIALDDYGSGYNGDAMLLHLNPEFVKVDISIVKGISTDENKRKLLENLVSYSTGKNINIIAEGIETKEDMETVIEIGVDYLQGFYLGMPAIDLNDISPTVKEEILEIGRRNNK